MRNEGVQSSLALFVVQFSSNANMTYLIFKGNLIKTLVSIYVYVHVCLLIFSIDLQLKTLCLFILLIKVSDSPNTHERSFTAMYVFYIEYLLHLYDKNPCE